MYKLSFTMGNLYRYSSKTVNLYTSKIPKNSGYFDMYKLSFTMGNLYNWIIAQYYIPINILYL
ncbi:hypothetical protein SAMN02745912_02271 [Paramaledivibacter caminithermalis DSM 15212]|jgi:hypothetical protein|uniref:Uncharacterized protein n=1 Tax=Paramaledivibacter caminithermalis (strain DSM 15212 / CIP 107654 / DViRD3) TaxID=1121301 RepID=A0A1M6PS29_PARC5|nr:hypothetical protein SAMN02745912_02271 [Paramaledivibacter caminithermalis DSM 15212]